MRRPAYSLITAFLLAIVVPTQARADLNQKQARKLIRTIAGMSLPGDSVRIQKVRMTSAEMAEARAQIELVFRLAKRQDRWRLSEIRTGQDRWEHLDIIAQAANTRLPEGECDAPVQFAGSTSITSLTVKRARCLVAALFGVALPSDEVRIKEVSQFALSLGAHSSALVVALVEVDFRFARDRTGWRVAELKSGNRDWASLTALPEAIDQLKRSAATDELSMIAKALDAFRRERGFFVVSDRESVLIDHLSPRYLARVIRLDPWHRPYEYEGEQDRFSLRSVGPDGKPRTSDDIVVSGP